MSPRQLSRISPVYDRRMDMNSDTSAFILTGGKSTRMGTDKAFVMLNGSILLDRMLQLARSVTGNVLIVGDPEKFSRFASVVEDIFPDCGPLAGIHAALRATSTEWNVILAVDLPFVTPALLHHLLARAMQSAAEVTVPNMAGLQPLCAVYGRAFADRAEDALRAGHYKIDVLFSEARTEIVGQQELEAAGFSAIQFRNLNSQQDLATARGLSCF